MSRRGTGRHPASPWRRGQVCPGDRQRHRATCYTTEGALVTFRQAGAGVAPRNPRKPGVTRAKRDADEGCFGAETEPRVWPDALCQSQIQKRGSGTWATPCYLDPDPPSPVTNLPGTAPSLVGHRYYVTLSVVTLMPRGDTWLPPPGHRRSLSCSSQCCGLGTDLPEADP